MVRYLKKSFMNKDQLLKIRTQEQSVVRGLLKKQNELLGQTLMNLDHLIFLQKSISLLSLKEINDILAERLPYILSVHHFSLFLYDKNKRQLSLVCHNRSDLEDELTLPLSGSEIMHDAVSSGRYILEPDFAKSRYFKGKKNPQFKCGFMVTLPLMIENETIGCLNLNDNDKGYFNVSDLDFALNVAEFVSLSMSNALLYEKTEMLAVTDGLTGITNHQQMQVVLKSEFHRCRRYKSPLSVIILDVDYFKKVNDSYGHQMGDDVLREVAALIKRFCRANDVAARYGGEEFVLILPETGLDGAIQIAERVRCELEGRRFSFKNTEFQVTLSCGVSEFDGERMKTPADLIKVADNALYRAKSEGRNRTVPGRAHDILEG